MMFLWLISASHLGRARMTALADGATLARGDQVTACEVALPSLCPSDLSNEGLLMAESRCRRCEPGQLSQLGRKEENMVPATHEA